MSMVLTRNVTMQKPFWSHIDVLKQLHVNGIGLCLGSVTRLCQTIVSMLGQ